MESTGWAPRFQMPWQLISKRSPSHKSLDDLLKCFAWFPSHSSSVTGQWGNFRMSKVTSQRQNYSSGAIDTQAGCQTHVVPNKAEPQ